MRVAFLLIVLHCVAPRAVAEEARCSALGPKCVCSEPMDAADGIVTSGHNFSDSAVKECSGFLDTNKGFGNLLTVSEIGMPADNTVDNVLRIQPHGGGVVWLYGRGTPEPTDARVCIRFYHTLEDDSNGDDWSGTGPNFAGCTSERNKLVQFSFADVSAAPYQISEPAGVSCTGPGTYNGLSSVHFGTGPQYQTRSIGPSFEDPLTWDDCKDGNWCRIEACMYGDLLAGTDIYVDVRAMAPGRGTFDVLTHGPVNPGFPLDLVAADLFHGQGREADGTPIAPEGDRLVSHFMQAAWTTNSGQWIGPAAEIEDGLNVCPTTTDVNQDGSTNTVDIFWTLQNSQTNGQAHPNADTDVDCDGATSLADVFIVQYVSQHP